MNADALNIPDTADLVGPDADDPGPVEVTEPDDLSYVEPAEGVEPVDVDEEGQ